LAQASVDGRLEGVLAGVKGEPPVPPPEPPNKLAACEDEGQAQAKATAPLDNQLSTDAPNIGGDAPSQQDVSQLRSEARDLLAQASVDGRLEGVLAGVKGDAAAPQDVSQPSVKFDAAQRKDISDFRAEMGGLLVQATVDGRLESVLAGAKGEPAPQQEEEDIDALRQQAKEKLLHFSQQGGFQSLSAPSAAEEDEVAELRDVARGLLADASETGQLERILCSSKDQEEPTIASPAGLARKEMAVLRQQAAQAQQDVADMRQTFHNTKQEITELQSQALSAKNDVTEIRDWAREAKKDMDDLRKFANEAKMQMQAVVETSKAA